MAQQSSPKVTVATEEWLENDMCVSLHQTERTESFNASCERVLSTPVDRAEVFWTPRGTHEVLSSVVLFHRKASLLQDPDA